MEALGVAWPLDDLEAELLLCGGSGGLATLVAAVDEEQDEPREAAADAAADPGQAVAILDVGRMDDQDDQAERVGEQMALAADALLAGVIATDSAGFPIWISGFSRSGCR